MKKRLWITLFALLATVLLIPVAPVLADDGDGEGTIIWNEDYTVAAGERVEGNLIVFNGNLTIEEGGVVEGSAVVWNGSADVNGVVQDDLVVSNGDIRLGASARIEGSVVCSWNCDVEQSAGAEIEGGVIKGSPLPFPGSRWVVTREGPSAPRSWRWANGSSNLLQWLLRLLSNLIASGVIAALAGLATLVWPDQVRRIGQTATEAPWASLGWGLLAELAAAVFALLMVLTICVPVVVALVLIAAGLFGWIGLGALIGERLLQALKVRETAPVWAAVMGTLIISLVAAWLNVVPCVKVVGWLLILSAGCLGLGAVVLTRFGTRPYLPTRSGLPTPGAPYA